MQKYNIFLNYANNFSILLKKTKMHTAITALLYKVRMVVEVIVFRVL